MKTIFLLLLFATITYSQTISFNTTYHFGKYGIEDEMSGEMKPTFDWELGLYVPLTEKISVTPSIYFYNAAYIEPLVIESNYIEKFWYVGITLEYTFSEEPLFK